MSGGIDAEGHGGLGAAAEKVEDPAADEIVSTVSAVAVFQSTGDLGALDGIFARGAVIVDSFAPFVFSDPAVWAEAFLRHIGGHEDLASELLEPQEFSMSDDVAYLSQPVAWSFELGGRRVQEIGALAAVLVNEGGRWRISHLSWGVTGVAEG